MRQIVARNAGELARAADVVRGLTPQKPWRITLSPYRAKRSHEQNALLWAIYTEMCKGTGHTPEELHEAMKKKFLPPRFIEVGDESIPVVGSTAGMDIQEFSNFLEQVQAFAAAELGVVL